MVNIDLAPEAVRKNLLANTATMKTLAAQIQSTLPRLLAALEDLQGDVNGES